MAIKINFNPYGLEIIVIIKYNGNILNPLFKYPWGAPLNQRTQLLTTLKKYIKSKRWTYKDLAHKIDLTEPTIKRLFSKEAISLKRLEQICEVIGLSMFELVRLAEGQSQEKASELTYEQEEALAESPELLTVFYLLHNGWSYNKILDHYQLGPAELEKLLQTLDRVGLINLKAKFQVELLTVSNIHWVKDGPIRKKFEESATLEFIGESFSTAERFFQFNFVQLSEVSMGAVHRKLQKLQQDIQDLSQIDQALPFDQKKDVGILLALRPWLFSAFSSIKTKKG